MSTLLFLLPLLYPYFLKHTVWGLFPGELFNFLVMESSVTAVTHGRVHGKYWHLAPSLFTRARWGLDRVDCGVLGIRSGQNWGHPNHGQACVTLVTDTMFCQHGGCMRMQCRNTIGEIPEKTAYLQRFKGVVWGGVPISEKRTSMTDLETCFPISHRNSGYHVLGDAPPFTSKSDVRYPQGTAVLICVDPWLSIVPIL